MRALKSLLQIKGANCFHKGAGWSRTQEVGECDFLISGIFSFLGLRNASVWEGRPLDSLYIILIPEMLVCLKPAQDISGPLVH